MAFLIVAGVTVPVAVDSTSGDAVEVGDRTRAFDGTALSTIRDHKDEFRITTVPMLRATANTLESALKGTPPLTCSGDLLGASGSYHVAGIGKRYIKAGDGERVALTFSLLEA